jgi:type IV pilus assembly protein PilC
VSAGLYHYTARSQQGGSVAGTLRVESERDAIAHLRARGLFITSLESTGCARGRVAVLFSALLHRRDATARVVRFLATLVASGVPLRRALRCTIEQCNEEILKEALQAVAQELDAGVSLSEAMRRRPREFPEQLAALVAAGELGGILDQTLDRAASLLEREGRLRKQLASALTYPAVVLPAAIGLTLFLLVSTVPAFGRILTELHAQLPLSTAILLAASDLIRTPTAWLLGTFVGGSLIAAIVAARYNRHVLVAIDGFVLNVPVIGAMQRSVNIAAFTRTLGTLLQCGVVITDAVRTAGGVTTSAAYQKAAARLGQSLGTGTTLAPLLAENGLFGAVAVEMAYVGEESGSLDAMLVRIAEHHEGEVEQALRVMTGILEPAIILGLGGIIGTIVASILVPLYGAIGSLH